MFCALLHGFSHAAAWLTRQQASFSRVEVATALGLGRLLDQGGIQLGCRLTAAKLHHDVVRVMWMEPLGRWRHLCSATAP